MRCSSPASTGNLGSISTNWSRVKEHTGEARHAHPEFRVKPLPYLAWELVWWIPPPRFRILNYSLQGLLLVATLDYCDSAALPPTTRTGEARYKHKLCPVRPTESHNAQGPSAA